MGPDFDFQNVAPMPDSIKYTQSGTHPRMLAYTSKDLSILKEQHPLLYADIEDEAKTRSAKDYLTKRLQRNAPFQEYCKKYGLPATLETLGNQLFDNVINHGCLDWYRWAMEHWGTKWSPNPDQVYWGDYFVEFLTAWEPAAPIAQTLSHLCPLVLEWTEEQIDQLGGYFIFENGENRYHEDYLPGSLKLFEAYQRMSKDDNVRYNRDHFVFGWNDTEEFLNTPVRQIKEKTLEDFLECV